MGVDFHVGDRYWSFHVPELALLAVAVIVVVAVWKLRRFILAAISGWHPS